jgi:hypothetical protein
MLVALVLASTRRLRPRLLDDLLSLSHNAGTLALFGLFEISGLVQSSLDPIVESQSTSGPLPAKNVLGCSPDREGSGLSQSVLQPFSL